ncbi:hypothetical protein [Nonomuraea fuscirosea]|uniref:hypothetical protein n=1 Tax=Nonomuraea fuscirosea TaxID=1291556 RepID=UPI003183AC23
MAGATEIQELRPPLFSISYRPWVRGRGRGRRPGARLRFEASSPRPASTRAFLSTTITRISIDVLRSARLSREEYVGEWFPEPLLADPHRDPERSVKLADSVSTAALLLERLSPLERAAFVLREVFRFDFAEVASTGAFGPHPGGAPLAEAAATG